MFQEKKMSFCSNCGVKLTEGANFCSSCGKATTTQNPPAQNSSQENTGNPQNCPSCGASVEAMTAICRFCNYEFRNVQVPGSVQAFFERLDSLEQQAFEHNANKEQKGPIRGAIGAMLGLDVMYKLATGVSAADKRKIEMIKNFPIPNAKEDIMDFIILACSRVDIKVNMFGNMNYIVEKKEADKYKAAWTAKIKQAYMKAQIVFGPDKTGLKHIEKIIKDAKVKL
jgi:hypothetical protein